MRSCLIPSREEEANVHCQGVMRNRQAVFVVDKTTKASPQGGVIKGLRSPLPEGMCQFILLLQCACQCWIDHVVYGSDILSHKGSHVEARTHALDMR